MNLHQFIARFQPRGGTANGTVQHGEWKEEEEEEEEEEEDGWR